MKQVINGKLYDTETAKEICYYQYSYPQDLYYVYEGLYLKKNGEFFLYATGGPGSKYGIKTSCNGYGGSTQLMPLSIDEAKKFVEKYGTADQYIALFGLPEE